MNDICDKGPVGRALCMGPLAGAVTKAVPLRAAAIALAVASGGLSSTAMADGFQLSEKLSITGFLDMSFLYVDDESATESTQDFGLDQFEIDFLYQFNDQFTAQVDLEYQDDGKLEANGDPEGAETDIEQAFFTYAINDSVSLKAGRFLSYSGWESEEPTGLFQYSGTGYGKYFYGAYQQGVSAYYDAGMFDLALSVVNDLGNLQGDGTDNEQIATELMLAVTPFEGVTAKAFYMTEGEVDLINVWASYATGGLTLAAEYNTAEGSAGIDSEADGYLLMANYATGIYGITLRYHEWEVEDASGTTVEEMNGITLSPSITVNDNLLLVFEYRMDEDDLTGNETDSLAVEALVTF
ncbi:MAG: porin [Candidatus Thiodiazotropha sp.]